METDPTRMCELLVGLPDVAVVGVGEWPRFVRIAIVTRTERPVCAGCGGGVHAHDVDEVELADLPCFGRRTRLVWSKRRWRCPNRRLFGDHVHGDRPPDRVRLRRRSPIGPGGGRRCRSADSGALSLRLLMSSTATGTR